MNIDLSPEWNEDIKALLIRKGWQVRLEVPGFQAELTYKNCRPIQVPLDENFGDFYDQGVKLLQTISAQTGQSTNDLLYESMLTRFDTIELKHPSSDSLGLPLAQAENAVSAFIDSFQATAKNTNQQLPTYGSKRDVLNSLLKSEARLGHTQRGSFIFRIIVPIQKPLIDAPAQDSDFLPRKSTLNYANSVKHTREALETAKPNDLEQIIAPFVERVKIIASTSQEKSPITLSSSFSRYDPVPGSENGSAASTFTREDVPGLESIVSTLKARSKQAPQVLIGFVYKLRSHRKANSVNIASIRAPLSNGNVRTFNLYLKEEQYNLAVKAHEETLYVRVTTLNGFQGANVYYPDTLTIVEDSLFST